MFDALLKAHSRRYGPGILFNSLSIGRAIILWNLQKSEFCHFWYNIWLLILLNCLTDSYFQVNYGINGKVAKPATWAKCYTYTHPGTTMGAGKMPILKSMSSKFKFQNLFVWYILILRPQFYFPLQCIHAYKNQFLFPKNRITNGRKPICPAIHQFVKSCGISSPMMAKEWGQMRITVWNFQELEKVGSKEKFARVIRLHQIRGMK